MDLKFARTEINTKPKKADLAKIEASVEKEKSIILACDQLTLNNFIEQNNWDTLNNHLNTSQIIELQMLIGHYSMLAGVINSSGLQLEYSIENNLQEFYRRIQNL